MGRNSVHAAARSQDDLPTYAYDRRGRAAGRKDVAGENPRTLRVGPVGVRACDVASIDVAVLHHNVCGGVEPKGANRDLSTGTLCGYARSGDDGGNQGSSSGGHHDLLVVLRV